MRSACYDVDLPESGRAADRLRRGRADGGAAEPAPAAPVRVRPVCHLHAHLPGHDPHHPLAARRADARRVRYPPEKGARRGGPEAGRVKVIRSAAFSGYRAYLFGLRFASSIIPGVSLAVTT